MRSRINNKYSKTPRRDVGLRQMGWVLQSDRLQLELLQAARGHHRPRLHLLQIVLPAILYLAILLFKFLLGALEV